MKINRHRDIKSSKFGAVGLDVNCVLWNEITRRNDADPKSRVTIIIFMIGTLLVEEFIILGE